MKNLKLFNLLTIICLCSLTFIACEKKDDASSSSKDGGLTAKDIVGEWARETEDNYQFYYFASNGLYEYEFEDYYYGDYFEELGTYTVSDNQLILTEDDGEVQKYSISKKGKVLIIDGEEFQAD